MSKRGGHGGRGIVGEQGIEIGNKKEAPHRIDKRLLSLYCSDRGFERMICSGALIFFCKDKSRKVRCVEMCRQSQNATTQVEGAANGKEN